MRELNVFGSSKQGPGVETPKSLRDLLSRLARHLAQSPCLQSDTLVFKGGLFLGEHTGAPRYTQDVDVSIITADAYSRVKHVLAEFGELLIKEGVITDYELRNTVEPGHSGGAKFKGSTGRILLSVDVSLGGEKLDVVTLNTSVAGDIKMTSVEQVLADKLSVLYSPRRFRRAKDLYDVWQIINSCTIDHEKLIACLRVRNVYPLPAALAPFCEQCYEQVEHAYNTLRILDPITEELSPKPDFSEIVSTVGKFTSKFTGAEV